MLLRTRHTRRVVSLLMLLSIAFTPISLSGEDLKLRQSTIGHQT
jgi:hypothetical protein